MLSLISCKTVTYEDIRPIIKDNQKKLSLRNTYINLKSVEYAFTNSYTKTDDDGNEKNYINDVRVNDTKNMYFKWADSFVNYVPKDEEEAGFMLFKINTITDRKTFGLVPLLHIYLLGIPMLFGVPYDMSGFRIEGEVDIYDKNGNFIVRYVEDAYSSAYIAMYYGYSERDVNRKVAADCIKEILEKIRVKIQKDYPYIVKKLNKANKTKYKQQNIKIPDDIKPGDYNLTYNKYTKTEKVFVFA